MATACSAWALAVSLLSGSASVGAPGDENGVATLVAGYYAGGLLCGAAAGLLLPLARSRTGAAVGGGLAAVPLYAAMEMTRSGLTAWTTREGIAAANVPAALVGGATGVISRKVFLDPANPDSNSAGGPPSSDPPAA